MVLECALDPADVIAIPSDYSNTKLRCCRYQILGVNTELTERRVAYVKSQEYEISYIDDAEWDEEKEYLESIEEQQLSGDYWF